MAAEHIERRSAMSIGVGPRRRLTHRLSPASREDRRELGELMRITYVASCNTTSETDRQLDARAGVGREHLADAAHALEPAALLAAEEADVRLAREAIE